MPEDSPLTIQQYNRLLAPYVKPAWKPAIRQLLNTVLPLLALLALMIYSLRFPYWVTLLLAIPAGCFMVRTFIIFHDCGHNSFTPSLRANKWIGFLLGLLVYTPGEHWWKAHAIHHATSGNIDRRGVGDVEIWTVAEYRARPWPARLGYRLFRHPLVMFGLGPIWIFLIANRLDRPHFSRKETLSIIWTNLALLVWLGLISLAAGGVLPMLMVMLPPAWLGGLLGIWMFYIQHNYTGVYWAHEGQWSYVDSAVRGASYYELPRLLQWITGNIGFHHIHHLSPRVPNYNLQPAYDAQPALRANIKKISFLESLQTLRLRLIDEAHGNRMVGLNEI